MELLVIKIGEQYIRVRESTYTFCDINKASVFPLDRVEEVRAHIRKLKANESREVCVKKLVIHEEDYDVLS